MHALILFVFNRLCTSGSLSDQCSREEKKILQEILPFHDMTYDPALAQET